MNTKIRSIRGFKDILPDKIKRWHYIEDMARTAFELHGYSEIRIPVLELTEVFSRSLGSTTDIVEKEMYTFRDRDGSSITLRPEGTAGVVRAYIENSLYTKSSITKLYYTGMMFRHERPQRGRYRGFYQIGAEFFGSKDPFADAEIIAMLWMYLKEIGITKSLQIELSTLGDNKCRPGYKEKLVDYFSQIKNELCDECIRRLMSNPLKILDCKKKSCTNLTRGAPSILENLCSECEEHFELVKEILDSIGVPYTINPYIVRGLDYYTRTVFEVVTGELGAQNAVAAGGRYDILVEQLGGPQNPAVGFAIGIDRIILLHEIIFKEGFHREVDFFIACLGENSRKAGFSLANDLRNNGLSVEIEFENKSLKSQLRKADKSGAKYTIIIGENELKRGIFKLRNMNKSLEEEMSLEDIRKLSFKSRT